MAAQMAFDLDYVDATTGKLVPWARYTPDLAERIRSAPWKVVDTETTGLNKASEAQNFSNKDFRRGVDPTLRLRILTVLIGPDEVYAFDFDEHTDQEQQQLATAAMTGMFIGQNSGFDVRWLSKSTPARPRYVLDTMLLARVLYPEHPLNLAKLCTDLSVPESVRLEAENMFRAGAGGWSLKHMMLGFFHEVMDKSSQGPKNWCQPFLSQREYDYATGDAKDTYRLFCKLIGVQPGEDLVSAYEALAERNSAVRLIEPQVADVCEMVYRGMSWSAERAEAYKTTCLARIDKLAADLFAAAPSLEPFAADLRDPDKGISAALKQAVADAFSACGLVLDRTAKADQPKVGEKDLRRVKATGNPAAAALFKAWTGLNRAKKALGMSQEVTGFAQRSGDGRIHPNTGHGPVTGRLSSSEPNVQQFPRDQAFRDCVQAAPGNKILGVDYSALDMRVGAALAIRAQEQILEAYLSQVCRDAGALRCINNVMGGALSEERARAIEAKVTSQLQAHMAVDEEARDRNRKAYWDEYRKLKRSALLSRFQRVLLQVRAKAMAAGTAHWGALRDAFSINGMDIHTWTALGMLGKDPQALFGGVPDAEVQGLLKHWKGVLGDQRQTGKVGNLSLLYAMQAHGLQDAAAKNYDLHWELDEAEGIRKSWTNTYLEIDLWHMWTELNTVDRVYIPDSDRGGKYGYKNVFISETLGGRRIYAFGLNAALSYEDQSTGADILGMVMKTLRTDHPDVFACVCNQVHDELVLEVPETRALEYKDIVADVMNACANKLLMPYGIPSDCSPALADFWVKD